MLPGASLESAKYINSPETQLFSKSSMLYGLDTARDAMGRSRYNYELSVKRAEAVRTWLVAHGIAAERLQAIGTGEARITGAHDDDRRVGFTVLVWAD